MSKTLAHMIAVKLSSIENCRKSNNAEWLERHTDDLEAIVRNDLPSGSGFDNGTKLDQTSKPERLVFNVSFHHMNDVGMYDGWTHHQIIVTPSLVSGIELRITGRDRRDIKEYIAEVFYSALSAVKE